ncbi:MAG: uroporphyrinogen-III synthase [Gaiellaceae bacterium]
MTTRWRSQPSSCASSRRDGSGAHPAQTRAPRPRTLDLPPGGWGVCGWGRVGERKLARLVLTRPAGQDAELARRLEALGHETVSCPLIAVELLGDGPVDGNGYDWLVVTSRNGAAELARRLRGRPARIAAIGPGTAAELESRGLPVDLVPRVSTQEGLVAELPQPPGRVLFAGAEEARTYLADVLAADVIPLYRTRALEPAEPPAGDLVVLASASAARSLGALPVDLPAVTIGPQTTRAAREAGIRVLAEAETHDLEGLVDAVARAAR